MQSSELSSQTKPQLPITFLTKISNLTPLLKYSITKTHPKENTIITKITNTVNTTTIQIANLEGEILFNSTEEFFSKISAYEINNLFKQKINLSRNFTKCLDKLFTKEKEREK